MAKNELSLVELLELALVKDEDKPYEVPSNWVWVKLGFVAKFIDYRGKTPKKTTAGVRLITAKNIRAGFISIEPEEFIDEDDYLKWMTRGIPEYGDVIITTEAPLGNVAQLEFDEKIALAQRAITLSVKGEINKAFLKYALMSPQMQATLNSNSTGSTVVGIKASRLKQIALSLPNKYEQQRIVNLVESHFEKLDRAKELVQHVLDSFENRKSAILNKAFKGELTANWRTENGMDFKRDWRIRPFKEVATVKSNLVDPMEYKNLPHIAPDNIEKRTCRLLSYNTVEQDRVISGKHRFHTGQILYSKIRPYLSKVVIVDFEGLCSADMYPIETQLNTRYLWYYMQCDDFVMAASSAGSRSVLPKINQKELGELTIVCSSIEEQKVIVRLLDKLLATEYRAKELCAVIGNIDLIKKSILSRALRGELSTNDPNKESALELLKEVLREKI